MGQQAYTLVNGICLPKLSYLSVSACVIVRAYEEKILADMLIKTVLVTGANRGLGLEFVRQFLSSSTPPEHLVATYRDPNTSRDLLELAKTESSLHAIQLDVTNSKAFPDLVSQLEKLFGTSGLNLLINNAGYKESELRDLDSVTEEQMVKHFRVNCVAPLLLSR